MKILEHPEILTFINQFPGMVGYLDNQHKVLMLNQTAIKLLGFRSLEHAIGKTSFDIPSKAAECAEQYILQDDFVLNNEKSLQVIDISEYSDGSIHIWLTTKSLLRDDAGNKTGVCYYAHELNLALLNQLFSRVLELPSSAKPRTYWLNQGGYLNLLSDRQQECLYYLIRGKSCREISIILSISQRTVETHTEEIKNKLGCQTKSELIEKAINAGMLYAIPKSLLRDNTGIIL